MSKHDNTELHNKIHALVVKNNWTPLSEKYFYSEVEDSSRDQIDSKLHELERDYNKADYELIDEIGKGAFGAVYKGRIKKSQKIIAIKIIDLETSKDDLFTITREINALSHGSHCPQLINYFGSTILGTKLWIGMEFVDGGSIYDFIKSEKMTERKISIIIREILIGLQYLSLEGKIHRDIKCANVLLTKTGQVKLADFGASAQLTDTMTKCGTFVGMYN